MGGKEKGSIGDLPSSLNDDTQLRFIARNEMYTMTRTHDPSQIQPVLLHRTFSSIKPKILDFVVAHGASLLLLTESGSLISSVSMKRKHVKQKCT